MVELHFGQVILTFFLIFKAWFLYADVKQDSFLPAVLHSM